MSDGEGRREAHMNDASGEARRTERGSKLLVIALVGVFFAGISIALDHVLVHAGRKLFSLLASYCPDNRYQRIFGHIIFFIKSVLST